MDWHEGLSDEQKCAASHVGGHARLLAGPGTGKTRVLTRRILYLIEEEDVHPASILALTFTRAAAAQLRREIDESLSRDRQGGPHVSTIHSYALTQLVRNPTATQLPQPLRIADDYEEQQIVQQDLKRLLHLAKLKEVNDMLKLLGAGWDRNKDEFGFVRQQSAIPRFVGAWQEHRTMHGYTLRSELVYRFARALERGELERWDAPRYLLVDEHQDLNPCEHAVVRQMARHGTEVYVAGDDDQGIYGWRHADRIGFRAFPTDYHAEELSLKTCWRCAPRIIDLARNVIQQDYDSLPKQLQPCKCTPRGQVHVLQFADQCREAKGIAQLCFWLVHHEGLRLGEILILLRSDDRSAFSEPIVSELTCRGLSAHSVSNPLAPLHTDTGREFVAFLYLVSNPQDHLAWRSLLRVRNNSLGEKTVAVLYDKIKQQGMTFYDGLREVVTDPDWAPTKGHALHREVEDIQRATRQMQESLQESSQLPLREWLVEMCERVMGDVEARAEVLMLFDRVVSTSQPQTLPDFLRALNTAVRDFEQERDEGVIPVMTMHQAKGLTATAVIVASAEEQHIPADRTGDERMEELRLLYVSLTRARTHLFVTYCTKRLRSQRFKGSEAQRGRMKRNLTTFLEHLAQGEPGEAFLKQCPS